MVLIKLQQKKRYRINLLLYEKQRIPASFFFPFYNGTIRIIVYSCLYYSSSVIGIGPYEGRICLAPFLVVFCKIIQSSTDHKKGTEKEYCLCIVKVTLFFVFKVLKRNN